MSSIDDWVGPVRGLPPIGLGLAGQDPRRAFATNALTALS